MDHNPTGAATAPVQVYLCPIAGRVIPQTTCRTTTISAQKNQMCVQLSCQCPWKQCSKCKGKFGPEAWVKPGNRWCDTHEANAPAHLRGTGAYTITSDAPVPHAPPSAPRPDLRGLGLTGADVNETGGFGGTPLTETVPAYRDQRRDDGPLVVHHDIPQSRPTADGNASKSTPPEVRTELDASQWKGVPTRATTSPPTPQAVPVVAASPPPPVAPATTTPAPPATHPTITVPRTERPAPALEPIQAVASPEVVGPAPPAVVVAPTPPPNVGTLPIIVPIPDTPEEVVASMTTIPDSIVGKDAPVEVMLGYIFTIDPKYVRRFEGQPRKEFDPVLLDELGESIATRGQIMPILVRPVTGDPQHRYEIIYGERRWRACTKRGLSVACITYDDMRVEEAKELYKKRYEQAVLENLHRVSFTRREQVDTARELLENFDHTRESAAKLMNVSLATFNKIVAMFKFPAAVLDLVGKIDGNGIERFSIGQAELLLAYPDPDFQIRAAIAISKEDLNIHQTGPFLRAFAQKNNAEPIAKKAARVGSDATNVLAALLSRMTSTIARHLDSPDILAEGYRRRKRDVKEADLARVKGLIKKLQDLEAIIVGSQSG